ncbi:MAG: hypothetical protein ACI3T9_05455 [Romboutsia timonensis]
MATLINNAGVKHYANKMVLAENRKVGSKSLPTALADIDNLIDEMKTQFDAEYGSELDMKLENNNNIFSVGTGSGIDKSGEVENSFTDIEIMGKTLNNLFNKDETLIPHLENFTVNSRVDKGLYEEINLVSQGGNPVVDWYVLDRKIFKSMIKKNTTYSIIIPCSLNENMEKFMFYMNGYGSFNSGSNKNIIKFTTTDVEIGSMYFYVYPKAGTAESTITVNFPKKLIVLEGDYTNTPAEELPQYFEGLKSIGATSKNLFNDTILNGCQVKDIINNQVIYKIEKSYSTIDPLTHPFVINKGFKDNTQYCFTFTTEGAYWINLQIKYTDGSTYSLGSMNQTKSVTTNSGKTVEYISFTTGGANHIKDIQLEESIIATQYEPYYDGYKIEVSSKSKNLISKDIEWTWGDCSWGNGNSYPITTPGGRFHNINFIKVNPNTKYTTNFLMKGYTTPQPKLCSVLFYRKNGTYIGGLEPNNNRGDGKPFVFTTPSDCRYLRLRGDLPADGDINNTIMLCLGEVTEFPHYEVCKEDKKQILLSEPLRGLPNGVKDSIELIDGKWKLVRRCGEVVFDANTLLSGYASNETKEHIYASVKDCKKGHGNILVCDRFTCVGKSWESGSVNTVTTSNFNSGQIGFTFDIGKYGSVSALNEWLSQNPTKVIYELETPTVEDVDFATLQCWKNGTISIDEVLPVETTHTVALNKPAQIKRNIEELTVLRKRVQALEDFYDQIALEQAYQLSLINHSIELDYNI